MVSYILPCQADFSLHIYIISTSCSPSHLHAYRVCKVEAKDVDLCFVLADEAGPTAN